MLASLTLQPVTVAPYHVTISNTQKKVRGGSLPVFLSIGQIKQMH